MPYRTLEELRSIVSKRLGFGSAGASLGGNATLIDSWLSNAQYQIYWLQNWKKLTKRTDLTVGVGQTLIDYPTTADPERILKMSVNIGTGTDSWHDLIEGIETWHYNTVAIPSYPLRYERYEQIELWPQCDVVRTLRVWFIKARDPFTENSHRATVDDELILLHATSAGKSHYRQPDAPTWSSQLDAMLAKLRGTAFGNKRFHAPGKEDTDVQPRPVVV